MSKTLANPLVDQDIRTPSLSGIQALMNDVITRRLDASGGLQQQTAAGSSMHELAADFIKPNSKLSSFARLEIYNQQYWYRLMDALKEDFPGLANLLGEESFQSLCTDYLEKYGSSSFTLRNLGQNLPGFVRSSQVSTRKILLASNMAALEWADILAFDSEAKEPLNANDLSKTDSGNLNITLQPHITPLKLEYPCDQVLSAIKQNGVKEVDLASCSAVVAKSFKLPKKERIYLVIHRVDNNIFHKRVDANSFRLLSLLKDGNTLANFSRAAVSRVSAADENVLSKIISDNFSAWMQLGWLCKTE